MQGFTKREVVQETEAFTVWRSGTLVAVELRGLLDDAVSEGWRAGVLLAIERGGQPRFIAVDFSRSDPQNSMASRFRSMAFAREQAQRAEDVVVFTGERSGPRVVVRAVLRAMGLANVHMAASEEAYATAVERMREGKRPLIGGH